MRHVAATMVAARQGGDVPRWQPPSGNTPRGSVPCWQCHVEMGRGPRWQVMDAGQKVAAQMNPTWGSRLGATLLDHNACELPWGASEEVVLT